VALDLGLVLPEEPGQLFGVNRDAVPVRLSDAYRAPSDDNLGERIELERDLFMTDPDVIAYVRLRTDDKPEAFEEAVHTAYARGIDRKEPEVTWYDRATRRMLAIMNRRLP